MNLRIDKLLRGAAASSIALTMFVGCNTFEGMGEDVADAGDAIQRVGDDDRSQRAEIVYSDDARWQSGNQAQVREVQMTRSESRDVKQLNNPDADLDLQAQRWDAGLYSAEGRKINPQQRQQMASSQMREQQGERLAQRDRNQQQIEGRITERGERTTDAFGFAEDVPAGQQQKLTGTVADVARIPHITLRTDDGREVIALLNQAQTEQVRKLEQGKKVTLNGAMREHEGQQVFVVQSIQEVQNQQSDRPSDENARLNRDAEGQALGFAADQNAQERAAAEQRDATERTDRAQQERDRTQHADKANKKHALIGTVEKIEEVQGEKGPHLMVKSDKGDKTYRVDLTGVEEAKLLKKEINEGDKVTLIGSIVKSGHAQQRQQQPGQEQQPGQAQPGQDQAQASSQQHQLFKADKMHKGVIAEVMQTYAFVGEGDQLRGKLSNLNAQAEAGASANIMSEDGRTVQVDLSQVDRAKLQGLQNEQTVTVTGSIEQKEGRQVFVATDIKQDGQQDQQRDQQQDKPAQRSDQAPSNQPQP